jgi:hypothetical protein
MVKDTQKFQKNFPVPFSGNISNFPKKAHILEKLEYPHLIFFFPLSLQRNPGNLPDF